MADIIIEGIEGTSPHNPVAPDGDGSSAGTPSQLAAALAAAQQELTHPLRKKTATLPGRRSYRYAGLDDLLAVVRPVLAAHGVAFVQTLDLVGGQVVLRTRLWIENGEEVQSVYPMQWAGSHHDRGSEITYARRYSLEAIVGVAATEDVAARRGAEAPAEVAADDAPPAGPVAPVLVPTAAEAEGRRRRSTETHPSYSVDRHRFCAKLDQHGTSYEEVASACRGRGWPPPASWSQAKRDGLLQAFATGTAWGHLGLPTPEARELALVS